MWISHSPRILLLNKMSINQWDFILKEFPSAASYIQLYPVVEIKNVTCVFSPIDQNTFINCMTTFQDLSFDGIKADMVKMCNDKCVKVINQWRNCMQNASYPNPDLLSYYYRSSCVSHPTKGYNCLTDRLEYMQSNGNSIQDYLQNTNNAAYNCDSCTRESMRTAITIKDYLGTLKLQDYGVDTLNKAQGHITEQCSSSWDQLVDAKPLESWELGLIIAGSIVGFLLLATLIFCCIKRRNKQKVLRPPTSDSMRESTSTLYSKLPVPSKLSSSNSNNKLTHSNSDNKLTHSNNDHVDQYEEYKVSAFQ